MLGIELFEANRNVIDTAANRQMSFIKQYQCGTESEGSQRLLNELSAARICLLSATSKAAYDEQLRGKLKAGQPSVSAVRTSSEDRWRNDAPAHPQVLPTGVVRVPQPPIATPPAVSGHDARPVPASSRPALRTVAAIRSKILRRPKTGPAVLALAAGVMAAALVTLLFFVLAYSLQRAAQSPDVAIAQVPHEASLTLETPTTENRSEISVTPVETESGEHEEAKSLSRPPLEPSAPEAASLTAPAEFSSATAAPGQHTRANVRVDSRLPQTTKIVPILREATQSHPSPRGVMAVAPAEPVAVLPAEPIALPNKPVAMPEVVSSAPTQETPPLPPAETLEQADKRLQAAADQASSSADHQALAQESLSLADKAILDSQIELAKRIAERALAEARKSESDDLVTEATLLWSELEQPLTDELKERARQRLREREP